jgi:UDP-sulfoquinovose synthase
VNTDETAIDPRLVTRFDYDTAFGAAVNRFCAQALALGEISIHGDAEAAYPLILLDDAVRCIELAVAHPPQAGEPIVCNQLGQVASLRAMAGEVARAAAMLGEPTAVVHTDPAPRRPAYRAVSARLPALGFRPTPMSHAVLRPIMETLRPHRGRIVAEALGYAHRAPILSGAHP